MRPNWLTMTKALDWYKQRFTACVAARSDPEAEWLG